MTDLPVFPHPVDKRKPRPVSAPGAPPPAMPAAGRQTPDAAAGLRRDAYDVFADEALQSADVEFRDACDLVNDSLKVAQVIGLTRVDRRAMTGGLQWSIAQRILDELHRNREIVAMMGMTADAAEAAEEGQGGPTFLPMPGGYDGPMPGMEDEGP